MISIIIPAYNAETYLERCLKSVLSQSDCEFEILVINDGSTDSTAEILDAISNNDQRLRVFHNENHGVSFSRNFGISKAMGEYIMFLDSDDWLEDGALKVISENLFAADKYGLLSFNHYDEYPDRKVERGNGKDFLRARSKDEINSSLAQITPNFVWDKVFSRKAINELGLMFDVNIAYGEDTIFLSQYIQYVNEVVVIPRFLHHYHRDIGLKSLSEKYVKDIDQIIRRLFEEQEKIVSLYPAYEESLKADSYRGFMIWRAVQGVYNLQSGKKSRERIEVMNDYNSRRWFEYLKTEWEHKSLLGKIFILLLKSHNMMLVDFAMHMWYTIKSTL